MQNFIFKTLAIILALIPPLTARAATPPDNPSDHQMLTFYVLPSVLQENALKKFAKEELAKAKSTGTPIEPRVAMLPAMIVISLESVDICDWVKGCPLLVFRDIKGVPSLKDNSYQNISVIYRKKGTYLRLRNSGPDRECLIPKTGKAKCTEVKPAAKAP